MSSPYQVKELIRAVRPDVVMLELCKDRVGLLADDRLEAQASNKWHVRKVSSSRAVQGYRSKYLSSWRTTG